MGIVAFALSMFFFMFYGRSLLRAASQQGELTQAEEKRTGTAILLFIALVVIVVNVAGWDSWLAFVAGGVVGFIMNDGIEH